MLEHHAGAWNLTPNPWAWRKVATARIARLRPDRRSPVMHVEAHDLVKSYPPGVRALDGLTLSIRARRGLRPARPQRRREVHRHQGAHHPGPPRLGPGHRGRARRAAASRTGSAGRSGSSRSARAADPMASGRDNLLLQGHLYGLRGRSLQHRVRDLLDRFGLAEAAGRAVKTYSGGMQRRLDVALGLVHRPSRAVPGRADHRPRPGGPGRAVAGDRPSVHTRSS